MPKTNFMQGAFILFLSGIFVKVLGFIYQILIIRIIGTEAVGLFNMVFPLYIMALVLSTAGLPLAVSKMVANQMAYNNYKAALKILKITVILLVFSGAFITLILFFTSTMILSKLYADPRVVWIFYTMLPSIIIVSISSAFRGFFQGLQQMTPTALTQCVEQVSRILVGVVLAINLQPFGIKAVAIGLAISMLIGEIISLFLIGYLFKRQKKSLFKLPQQDLPRDLTIKTIIYDLFSFGVPTTFTRLIASLCLTLEASLIPLTLQKIGYTLNQSASIYGQFSGVALPILTIPTVLTFSLAISLVPAISEAEAQGKLAILQFRTTESLRLTFLFGLPATIILLIKSPELCALLFNLPEAGSTLRILSFGAIFLYLSQTSNGILQGLGYVRKIFINTLVGTIIKICGIIFLVSIPEININGAAISFTFSYIVVCLLNIIVITKETGFYLTGKQILFPFLSSLIMAGILIVLTSFFSTLFSQNIVTLFSIILSSICYLMLVIYLKQFNLKTLLK